MTLQVELSWVVSLAITLVGAFAALAKMLLAQSEKHIDQKFVAISNTLKAQDDSSRRIERDLMDLKAELPRDYVRRDDHNRVVASIHISIDNLRLTIERALYERGGK